MKTNLSCSTTNAKVLNVKYHDILAYDVIQLR